MRNVRLPWRTWLVFTVWGTSLFVLSPHRAGADRVVLRGGGQIRGKVVPDPDHPDRVTVLTEKGKTPLKFQKSMVLKVIAEPSALDEYLARRDQAAANAEGQYDLALWCEKNKLIDLATLHQEAALKYDPAFAPAHQKLGHVLQGERWLNADELRLAQGLVRYKGRWITKEEKDQRESEAAATAEQLSWMRRIKKLRDTILYSDEPRQRDAESRLREIREPVAVTPLVRVLGESPNPIRTLLDTILGTIPGPEASSALVNRVLAEADSDVRMGTFLELEKRKELNVIPLLARALASTQPDVVNRAAWTLSNLNAISTVPKLIPALITTQYRVVWVASGTGLSGGGMSASFGSVAPAGGAPIAYNGSSVGVLTGAVAGPGSVAYGAAAIPYGTPSYNGLSTNSGGGSGGRSPTPKLVPISFQNVEVLAALVKMTGEDFGYNIPTWKRWVSTSFHPDPAPVRRVPQP